MIVKDYEKPFSESDCEKALNLVKEFKNDLAGYFESNVHIFPFGSQKCRIGGLLRWPPPLISS